MQLRFRTEKKTKVRFFKNLASLQQALKKQRGFLFLDSGLPEKLFSSLPTYSLNPGESCKTWSGLGAALTWLAGEKAERSQTLVAVGGGATLDFSALTASLYRRGLGLILVPTTLLSMVDASLGGKTAIDQESENGILKNFAGTFYPANEVWICPEFLSTLPSRERISGAGEVWKTLWLSGKKWNETALLSFVDSGKLSPDFVKIIHACLDHKIKIVEKDPLDTKRIRETLNYGHTIGHALESLAQGRISHGEAVLWGMAVESGILKESGKKMRKRAIDAIQAAKLELPLELFLPEESWLPFLKSDKKSKNGKIELTVLSAPGKPLKKYVNPQALIKLIKTFPESFRL